MAEWISDRNPSIQEAIEAPESEFLVWPRDRKSEQPYTAYYDPYSEKWSKEGITHWQPLPAPPEVSE